MQELINHIKAENAKTRAWIDEDPDNRWAGMIVEDPEHWKRMGVTTVEQYEHYMMSMTIYDLYKEVHGIRPRWYDFDSMSYEEMKKLYDGLLEELESQQEADKTERKYNEQESNRFTVRVLPK